MKILKEMPRGAPPRGLVAEPDAVKAIREALTYASSVDGAGLTRKNVWEALVESGSVTRGYKTFGEYCRTNEAKLWALVQSR